MIFHTLHGETIIPSIGFGTYKIDTNDADVSIKCALDAGYRLIDCAHVYENEHAIGRALAKYMNTEALTRDRIFITSKLWNTYHRPELVKKACEQTLTNLGVEYLDLYLIHWPVSFEPGKELFPTDSNGNGRYDLVPLESTWKAMEELVLSGLVKAIGLSNFNKQQIQRVLDCASIPPVNLQIESHLGFMNDQLIQFAKSVGMTVTAYCPLGAPAKRTDEENLLKWPVVCELAAKHDKTPAQILLRHAIQRGLIVIPKSSNPDRIRENIAIFDFELLPEEMQALQTASRNVRHVKPPLMLHHPEYPFNEA